MDLAPSPVVALNRAVALAMVDGAEAGIIELQRLAIDKTLEGNHLLPALLAEFCTRVGRTEEAVAYYSRAVALTRNRPVRRFLEGRMADISIA